MERYSRSIGTLTREEIQRLSQAKVAVVGCGGLGGYVLEMLGRMGVGQITVIDGDVLEESNLNRQLLSRPDILGMPKVEAAVRRMASINEQVKVVAKQEWFSAENGQRLLNGHDVVVDALDRIDMRFQLQDVCEQLKIPMVHGAIGGWYGQVAVIQPGDRTLNRLYDKNQTRGIEKQMGNPSFTPAVVAGIQATETIKLLIRRGAPLVGRILIIDLLEQEYTVIE